MSVPESNGRFKPKFLNICEEKNRGKIKIMPNIDMEMELMKT